MEAPRRAFLRGLATLPLVGGAVELIGNPYAVAMPVTNQLMLEYMEWLKWEKQAAIREFYGSSMSVQMLRKLEHTYDLTSHAFGWHHAEPEPPPPSTRAALVLSAVGFDWREPYR